MSRVLSIVLLMLLGLGSAIAKPASVVFLNPGYSSEPFWVGYTQFMQAAADDLGMHLQVIYGERDIERVLNNARQVLASPTQPDYLIFVNENYVGPELLRLFAQSRIKLFALHSTLTAEQQQRLGGTREQYGNWIGSLVPNDEEAGYLMAQALIQTARGKAVEMLAFSGVRNTPSALLREQGLNRALAEHPRVRLQQLVYGEWKRQRAYEQALALLPRYTGTRLVWSANDEMAFGAIKAASELGVGGDIRFSALNNSQEVLQARVEGRVSALVGGHFTLGAWAMVLLHDYHAGHDFARHGGKDQVAPLFRLLDAKQAAHLAKRLEQPGYGLDFRRYSLVNRPRLQNYSFSIDALLR
ncbi:MAG TPA: ABC transporter substrate-binding protein [Pseudomonas sp.]|nr:ABC transporter substrate-binding protein [Pseudomonas sp.]